MDGSWYAIAADGELSDNTMHAFELDGHRRLLVYTGGSYFVVDEMCSHEDYSLALGCIKDRRIKCSLHGSYFDLASGEALDEPADQPIGTYPVKVEAGQVWTRRD